MSNSGLMKSQNDVSLQRGLPVEIVSDSQHVESVSADTVTLYYYTNAYLTCATAGSTTYGDYTALTDTGYFYIELNGKKYLINPDFTSDGSMANVATSIQTALAASLTGATCTWSTDHFIITTAQASGSNTISKMEPYIVALGVDLTSSSWMNGGSNATVTDPVYTADAGQAAGVAVVAKLSQGGILDEVAGKIGTYLNTSFAFVTGTVLTTEVEFSWDDAERGDEAKGEGQLATIVKGFSSGEFCIDYRNGIVYGLKATTDTSDTANYKIAMATSGGGTVVSSKIDITKVGGTATLIQNSAFGTITPGLPVFGRYDATPITYDDGDAAPILLDAQGRITLSSDIQIGSVEIKDGTSDARQAVKVDNATAGATPTVALTGGIYKNALDTYADNDAAPIPVTANGIPIMAITSGAALTPIFDTAGHKGFVQVTNGTYDLALDSSGYTTTNINGTVTVAEATPSTLTGGSKTVTTAGTAEALGTTLTTKSIYIRANAANTSFICVGDSAVDESTNQQVVLYANDAISLDIADRATVYLDADVDGEGVGYLASS